MSHEPMDINSYISTEIKSFEIKKIIYTIDDVDTILKNLMINIIVNENNKKIISFRGYYYIFLSEFFS
jgi:hypothetical protein